MKKRISLALITQVILVLMVGLLLIGAKGFVIKSTKLDRVTTITDVTASINGEEKPITLPYSFKHLAPRTPVTIRARITARPHDVIYMKSVYSSAKIYVDDTLIHEFGVWDSYPSFMVDPATEVYMIPLGNHSGEVTLRMEFLSPIARDVLTVHAPILGDIKSVFGNRTKTLGMPFIFSSMQLIIGILLLLTSFFVLLFEKKGILFFWLGLFSLTTGAWAFGECNFSGVLFKNPTLLYLLAFMGLFTFAIPLLYFAMTAIHFTHEKLLQWLAIFMTIASSGALLLQLLGLVPLSKSMYLFHILVPLTLCILTGFTVYECIVHKEIGAMRFVLPIGILTLSSLLEVFNYQFAFTYMFASLFQMGILFFIVFTGIAGGLYIRDVIKLEHQQRELAFEVNLMEMQIEEQKKHSLLMVENAEKLRQQRHDLRHQLTVVKELADHDNEKLNDYISSLIEQVPSSPKSYCENPAVNAIVSRYASICEKNGIDCTINLTVPEHNEQMTDSSLCVIFGNLLENAVEACTRMTEGHKFIRLNSSLQYDMLTITMDNSFDGKVTEEQGKFRSRKREDFGIGLSSIQAVARKGQGDARFESDGLVFLSSVYVRV
ncbi:MAG: GHKL domain-containing protein [Lachnospiraceae bacterium]|nr:GHKL domain-containing protein [Lachnospiraceae bacterium]